MKIRRLCPCPITPSHKTDRRNDRDPPKNSSIHNVVSRTMVMTTMAVSKSHVFYECLRFVCLCFISFFNLFDATNADTFSNCNAHHQNYDFHNILSFVCFIVHFYTLFIVTILSRSFTCRLEWSRISLLTFISESNKKSRNMRRKLRTFITFFD